MVTTAVGNWFLSVVATVVGWIPALPSGANDSLSSFTGDIPSIMTAVDKFSPVVPFHAIGLAAGVVFLFWVAAIMVQLARSAASYITLGGGGV